MGLDILQTRGHIRKFLIVLVRTCYRSVCNHPFIVGLLLFLIFLYVSFPFAFSLLVSSSPILVSTAVLLGTLLSYGQASIPEIEKEGKETHEVRSLKTGASGDVSGFVEREERITVEDPISRRRGIEEEADERVSSIEEKISLIPRDSSSVDNLPLIDDSTREIQCKKQMHLEVKRAYEKLESEHEEDMPDDSGYKIVGGDDEEEVDDQYLHVPEAGFENHEVGNDISAGESEDDDAPDGLDSEDSGSDVAESSSPDASMTDIIPMLDELHPLLNSEAPQPAHKYLDTASQQSHRSDDGSDELDEDAENQEEEDGEEDIDDDEDAQVGTEGIAQSPIMWTEDDEKNLKNLGTSELERNKRLENLIARRKAQKNMRTTGEKNLIDLEGTDHSSQIAPILTAKHNPFDLPNDTYDVMGLLAIPGSAPSILLPGRNPFDSPCETNEETPDLTGESLQHQQAFMPFHQKDIVFRRHESFSVGPSVLGGSRQDRQDMKFRPYFISERTFAEGTSYPSVQRQSSEISDSKPSSGVKTESLSSTDTKDVPMTMELDESDIKKEADTVEEKYGSTSNSSPLSEESKEVIEVKEHLGSGSLGPDLSESSGHSMQSAMDDLENKLTGEKTIVGNNEDPNQVSFVAETISMGSMDTRDVPIIMELNEGKIHPKIGISEEEHSNISSATSLSEEYEESFDVKDNIESEALRPKEVADVEFSGNSKQTIVDHSGAVVINDSDNMDPVYDSSPPATHKHLSFSSSSFSSNLHVDMPEMGSRPELVETTASFAKNESGACEVSVAKGAPPDVEIRASLLKVHAMGNNEILTGVTETTEQYIVKLGSSELEPNKSGANETLVCESVAPVELQPSLANQQGYTEDHPNSSSQVAGQMAHQSMDKEIHHYEQTSNRHIGFSQDVDEKQFLTGCSYQSPHSEMSIYELDEQLPGIEVPMVDPSSGHEKNQEPSGDSNEEVNIVEGLLSELDTIGDFRVKETGTNANEIEGNLHANAESISMLHDADRTVTECLEDYVDEINKTVANVQPVDDSNSKTVNIDRNEMPVLHELHHAEEIPEPIEVEPSGAGLSPKGSNLARRNMDLPVLESNSVRSIDAPGGLNQAMDVEKPVIIGSLEAEVIPEHIKLQHSEVAISDKFKDSNSAESNLDCPVLEAKFVKNIDVVSERLNQGIGTEKPVVFGSLETKEIPEHILETKEIPEHIDIEHSNAYLSRNSKDSKLAQNKLKLPVMEASAEDIDLTFAGPNEGRDIEQSELVSSGNNILVNESGDIAVVPRFLPGMTSGQSQLDDLEKVSEFLDAGGVTTEVESKEVGSSFKEIEATANKQAGQEGSPSSSDKQDLEYQCPKDHQGV